MHIHTTQTHTNTHKHVYAYILIVFLQPNTFQLVLIYDPGQWRLSAMFLYEKTGWDRYYMLRDSQIGFYARQSPMEETRTLAQSGRESAFEMAQIVGNTGMWLFCMIAFNKHVTVVLCIAVQV